jgi:hypothetical protein
MKIRSIYALLIDILILCSIYQLCYINILTFTNRNLLSVVTNNKQIVNYIKTSPTPQILPNLPIVARITCYKETGNLTASGKVTKNGMVAVSDRSIPFGTEIIIDGQTYIVEDRTAYWVFTDFEHLTVDIFMDSGCDKNFGANLKEIIIK